VVSGTLTTGFTYPSTLLRAGNGAGDRVAKMVDGVTTDYVLDPAAGLTQVLQETTGGQAASYLYGADLLAQYDSGTWAYHVNDGLGSVRQLADPIGQVVQGYSFSPFGVPLGESGGEPYGFTGEQWDASAGLVFLRARYMQPTLGVFLSRDPWMGYEQMPGTNNGFNYAMGNPINLSDPSGLYPWSGIELMALCFDLHSLTHGVAPLGPHDPRSKTAKEAVELCRASYNKENWNKDIYRFGLGQDLPKTAHELFGWYVHEWRGKYKSDRLFFDGNEPLTRELATTSLVSDLRRRYYWRGENLSGPTHYDFKFLQYIQTGLLDISSFQSVPISFFMGSFWYQIKAVGSDRVGFRIDNDVTLESGSHIAGRFQDDEYFDSVEDLISPARRPDLANKSLAELIRDPEQYKLISILGRRTKEETEGSQGGGNLYQTFTWTERHDCYVRMHPLEGRPLPLLDIQVWSDFRRNTTDPEGFPPE
jgi:RHS repeat-associated protein